MFGSNRSANGSSHSRKTKKETEKKFELDNNGRLRAYDENKKSNETSKVEFRKVLKPRNKHSRVGELDDSEQKSIVSNRSSRFFSETLNDLEKEKQEKLEKETFQDKKLNFKNSPLNRVKNEENDIAIYQSKEVEQSRPQSSLPKRQEFYSSRSNIRPDKEKEEEHEKSEDNEEFNKKSLLRPKSSIYNFSPFENVKTKQRNTSQLSEPKNDLEKMEKIKRESMHTENEHNAINQFFILEQKIMNLLAVKWDIIEEKLMKEKEQSRISKPNERLKTKHNKPTFFENSLQKNEVSLKQNQKFSFSKALAEKNIDLEIMDLIKSLRKLNFSSLKSNKSIENEKIWSDIEQRRSEIIEKVLAESMVESELLKKYYSGQNAKCLSTSNHKVGQNNMKNKLMLENIKKIETSERTQVENSQRKISQQRESFEKQSESKSHFIAPNSEDYEKYRYKHPEFKQNLQPLPRSEYKSQFFNYSNVQIYNSKYKEQGNMVFPATSALKSSSYRKEYRQFSPERINYKELDAYKDKFKNIDIVYMPKKRSESEAYTTRKHSKVNKYVNKLDYVKRLKTESMIGNPFDKEITQRINCKLFTTESKNEYQNPEKLTQHFEKSEIKHKKLHMLKYDMKKKFRV